MVAALEENERSATFDGDLASTADVAGLDDPASVSIVPMHALSPYDPDAAASNDDADANAFPWRDLVPTGGELELLRGTHSRCPTAGSTSPAGATHPGRCACGTYDGRTSTRGGRTSPSRRRRASNA
jgi:hypothetical protein